MFLCLSVYAYTDLETNHLNTLSISNRTPSYHASHHHSNLGSHVKISTPASQTQPHKNSHDISNTITTLSRTSRTFRRYIQNENQKFITSSKKPTLQILKGYDKVLSKLSSQNLQNLNPNLQHLNTISKSSTLSPQKQPYQRVHIAKKIILLNISSKGPSTQWLLHITTWNYILSTLYFILVIGIGVRELVRERNQSSSSNSSYSVISISPREHEDGNLNITQKRSENAIPIIMVEGKELMFNYDKDDDDADSDFSYDDNDDGYTDDDFVDVNDDVISVGYQLPMFYRLTYAVFNVTGNLTIVIAMTYWSILHDYDTPIYMNLISLVKIDASMVILFWFLLEVLFNDIPIHVLHCLYPMLATLLYFFVYIVYTMATGYVVYKNIDFLERPGYAVLFVVVLLLGILLTQLVMFSIGYFKCYLAKKLNKMRNESSS